MVVTLTKLTPQKNIQQSSFKGLLKEKPGVTFGNGDIDTVNIGVKELKTKQQKEAALRNAIEVTMNTFLYGKEPIETKMNQVMSQLLKPEEMVQWENITREINNMSKEEQKRFTESMKDLTSDMQKRLKQELEGTKTNKTGISFSGERFTFSQFAGIFGFSQSVTWSIMLGLNKFIPMIDPKELHIAALYTAFNLVLFGVCLGPSVLEMVQDKINSAKNHK